MSASASRLRQRFPARWRWPVLARPLGLQSRIALLVASGLLALMTLFVALGLSALQESTTRGFQERAVLAQMAAEHLDFVLDQAAETVNWAAPYFVPPLQAGDRDAVIALLGSTSHRLAFIASSLLLFDPSGLLVRAEPAGDLSYPSLSPRAVQSLNSGGTKAIDWVRTPEGTVAVVLVPIQASGGQRVGYLGAALDFSGAAVGHWLSQLAMGKSGRVDVVDAEGMVLTSTNDQQSPPAESHASYFTGLMAEKRATVTTCYDCHATSSGPARSREVMAFAPLKTTDWGVVLRQSEDEVMEPTRQLQQQVLGLGAVSLLVALFMVWLTTRSIVGPIRALTLSARRIAEGNLSEAVVVQGSDEVGDLARALDYMRTRLQRSIEEIKGCAAELDRRVQERTAELERSRDDLESSRDYLQTMIDSLSDELMVIDKSFQVRRVNAALTRESRGDLTPVGRPCYLITHGQSKPCGPPCCECPAQRVWETGKPARALHVHASPGQRTRYVEVVVAPLRDRDGQVVELIEAMRDVTEERELEDELLRRNRELSTLNSIAVALNQSLDLEPILKGALLNALKLTGMEAGAVYLVDEHSGELELAAHHGLSLEAAQVAANLGLSASLCASTAQAGEPIVVEDTARYARGMRSVLRNEKMRCMVRVPFKSTRGLLGTMCLGTRTSRSFSKAEMELLTSVSNQIAVAVQNVRLYEELQRKERMRGELLLKVIAAQEEERKRIARELHDQTSQALAALSVAVETAAGQAVEGGDVSESLGRMRTLTVDTLEEVHRLIFDLRPTLLDDLGLIAAMRWYAETRLGEVGIKVRLEVAGEERRLAPQIETALYRVVQEAVNNVANHSGAQSATITLVLKPELLTITIVDDGWGFDMAELARSGDQTRGLGLMGMKERVELLGGNFAIYSELGGGTKITVEVPQLEGEGDGNGQDTSSDS